MDTPPFPLNTTFKYNSARLGEAFGEKKDIWWHARNDAAIIHDLQRYLNDGGLPFLDKFSTRDKIILQWEGRSGNMGASTTPRIVRAIILAERGQLEKARELLSEQVLETRNPRHPEYVRALAKRLGLGDLNG